jgi:hypothetical protein
VDGPVTQGFSRQVIGIDDKAAKLAEHSGHGTLAGADPAGQTDDGL